MIGKLKRYFIIVAIAKPFGAQACSCYRFISCKYKNEIGYNGYAQTQQSNLSHLLQYRKEKRHYKQCYNNGANCIKQSREIKTEAIKKLLKHYLGTSIE